MTKKIALFIFLLAVQSAEADSLREQKMLEDLKNSRTIKTGFVKLFSDILPDNLEADLALVQRLENEPLEIQQAAGEALVKRKPKRPQVHLALVKLLSAESQTARSLAVNVLGSIKPEKISVLQKITVKLTSESSDVRDSAVQVLTQIKPQNTKILMELTALLRHLNSEVQSAAAEAFHGIRPSDFKVLSAVVEEILSPYNAYSQAAAVHALKGMVFKDHQFLTYTQEMMHHENPYIQKVIIEVLAANAESFLAFQTSAMSQIIAEKLEHPNIEVRKASAKALFRLSSPNPNVEKALQSAIQKETAPDLKRQMFIALESIVLRRFLVKNHDVHVNHVVGAKRENFEQKTDPERGVVIEYSTTHDFSESGLRSKLKCLELFNAPLPAPSI